MAKTNSDVPEPEHTVSSAPRRRRSVGISIPSVSKVNWRPLMSRTKWLGLLAVLLIGMLGGYTGAYLQNRTSDDLFSSSVGNEKKVITSESQLVSTIAKNVGESVVSVNVKVSAGDENSDFRRYFGLAPEQVSAAGTGIIISKSGLVVTNRHVVPAGTANITITLSDGTELTDVKVVGRTSNSDSLDIAILKIADTQGHKLQPATLGNSSKVSVGDEVVAIGNALGQFQNTITTGIISGYGRSITASSDGSIQSGSSENLDNLFQTDAAINQGNSGGPLVNLNGQVIGINTAVASNSQNIGFAIPINDVKGLIKHVIETGKFERPYLGVRYIPLTTDIAKQLKLSTQTGAYIAPADNGATAILVDSPASKAGLKPGDIIVKVNGVSIDAGRSLTSLLGQYQPGDTVNLGVINGKETRTVKVTLSAAPPST